MNILSKTIVFYSQNSVFTIGDTPNRFESSSLWFPIHKPKVATYYNEQQMICAIILCLVVQDFDYIYSLSRGYTVLKVCNGQLKIEKEMGAKRFCGFL